MIRLLQLLFFGHVHKWKKMERVAVYDGTLRVRDERPNAIRYVCACETCGAIRRFNA